MKTMQAHEMTYEEIVHQFEVLDNGHLWENLEEKTKDYYVRTAKTMGLDYALIEFEDDEKDS